MHFGKCLVFLYLFYFQTKSTPSSECTPPGGTGPGAGVDQTGWNMGQDDSAVHGKHLPPSPRRQPNKSSLKGSQNPSVGSPPPQAPATGPAQETCTSKPQSKPGQVHPDHPSSPKSQGLQKGDRSSYSPSLSHKLTHTPLPSPTLTHNSSAHPPSVGLTYSPPPSPRSRAISDPPPSAEPLLTLPQNQPASTSILRRKVLSKETARQYQGRTLLLQGSRERLEGQGSSARSSYQSAKHVPWEKESSEESVQGLGLGVGQGGGDGAADPQEKGLLEEIESMCRLSSAFHTSLELSRVHCNSNNSHSHHHAQGKATEES